MSPVEMPPTTPEDFMTDEPVGPPPKPPEWATYIPDETLAATKRWAEADAMEKDARSQVADMVEAMALDEHQRLIDRLPQITEPVPGALPSPVAPNTEGVSSVEPIMADTALEDGPQGAPAPTPPASAPEDFGRQFWQGLQSAMQKGAAGVGFSPVLPDKPPESIGDAALGAAEAEAQRTKAVMGASGPTVFNPNTPAPMGGEGAPAARLAANAGEELGPAAVRMATGAGKEAAGEAATVGESAIESVVAKAKELVGDERVAAAQKHLDNPKTIARFEKTKNPDRDLKTASQRDAYDLWRASKQEDLVKAIAANDGDAAAQAVVSVAKDAGLPDLPPPRKPVWADDMAALEAANRIDQVIGEQVTRSVARDVALPSGRVPGGPHMQEAAARTAEERQAIHDAARAVNMDNLHAGAASHAAAEPLPRGADLSNPYGLSEGEVSELQSGEARLGDFPSGRAPGNPPPKKPLISGSLLEPGAHAAGAVAGGYVADQQAKDDDLMTRLVKVGIGAGMGATAASIIVGPGGLKGMGERAQSRYVGGLIGPKATVASGVQDVANMTLDAPTLRFAEALLQGHGIKDATQQSAAMLGALAHGDGVKHGLVEALHEFDPKVFGDTMYRGEKALISANEAASAGQYASSLGTRSLNAWTALVKNMMLAQEQAATHAGYAGRLTRGEHVTPDELASMNTAQVARRLFVGDAEGGLGKAGIAVGGLARKVPFIGPVLQPFVHVPAVFMDQTLSSIPVAGLLNAVGASNKSAVVARNIRGTLFTAGLGGLMAATGTQVTGGGPEGTGDNRAWRDQGFQPYSVKPVGSNKWVSIQNLPPLLKAGLLFLGTLDDFNRYGVEPKQMGQTAKEFGRSLGATDFVPTLARFALGDLPLAQQAQSQIGSAFPWYSRQTAAAGRDYQGDTKGTEHMPAAAAMPQKVGAAVEQGVQNAFPGEVPARQNELGEKVPNANQGLAGVLSPFRSTQEIDSKTIDAFKGVAVGIPDPPQELTVGSRKVALSGEAQREFQRVQGQYLKDHLPSNLSETRAKTLLQQAHDHAEREFHRTHAEDVRNAPTKRAASKEGTAAKVNIWNAARGTAPVPSAKPSGTSPWAGARSAA